jgi:hypothetical protein
MNTLFTFPRKNPKYSNLDELKKTCTYLNIQHNNIKKKDLIIILNNYYLDDEISLNVILFCKNKNNCLYKQLFLSVIEITNSYFKNHGFIRTISIITMTYY